MNLNETLQVDSLNALQLPDSVVRTLTVHDQLLYWATHEWKRRYADQSYVPVWAEDECGNKLALQRIKPGRKLKADTRYAGCAEVFCPFIMPVETYETVGR